MMRLVGQAVHAAVPAETRHAKGVQLVRELTEGMSRPTLALFVEHGISLWRILPGVLQSRAFHWLMNDYKAVIGMTDAEAVAVVLEARPDVADIVHTEKGMAWLKHMISGKDLGL